MKLYDKNNTLILEVEADDSSYSSRSIMGDKTLTLNYSLIEHKEIPLGSYCQFKGMNYYLFRPENFKKQHTRNFEYTLLLETEQALLRNFKFRSETDRPPRLKFSLTGPPELFLKLLVLNLNRADSGWAVGKCLEAAEITLDFNNQSCMEALNSIADAFKTEWEIEEKKISLGKVEKNKENAIPLSYGKGEGLKPGVGRSNYDNSTAITRLYVIGGERNIDPHTYKDETLKSKTLLLPSDKTITIEGRTYKTDPDGTYLERTDKPAGTLVEGSIDLSHIYPHWEGKVKEVFAVDDKTALYDFTDPDIPDTLDFNNYKMSEEEDMLVVFQKGPLAGLEFGFDYDHTDKAGNALRRFKLKPIERGSQNIPQSPLIPVKGNKYGIFNIALPPEYIEMASQQMLEEAARYFYENEDPRFTFTGELDRIYAQEHWGSIGGYLDIGYFVSFTDPQFQEEPVLIRITGIKEYVNNPYAPVLELSNVSAKNTFANKMADISNNEVAYDRKLAENYGFTKRRWRDAKETASMLEDALLDFSGGINPITVQTMSLLVGDESLQFRFVNNTSNPTEVPHNITYNSTTKILNVPGGIIQHMTLGINTLSPSHSPEEYQFWIMSPLPSIPIPDKKAAFLYAQVNKSTKQGSFRLSEKAIKLEEVNGFYHLLVGILNSEYNGTRNFERMYGFTEILPGRITTDKVVSADGENFMDFINNRFRVGNNSNYFEWNKNGDGKLRLKGTLVQSTSGQESPLGCFRGEYNSSYTYYNGDEVTYLGSSYRYIHAQPGSGIPPSNTNYWTVTASKGEVGSYKSFVFKHSVSQPAAPTGNTPMPSGWQDAPVVIGGVISNVLHEGAWLLQADGSRKSVSITHNGITKNRICFTTSIKNSSIHIKMRVSSEKDYDFALVGLPDNPHLQRNANYTDRISGNIEKNITINIPDPGSHFIEIAYAKDSVNSQGSDCCFYEVLNEGNWWMSSATITYINGEWTAGAWSTPVKVTGEDGLPGNDGKYWDYKYKVSNTQPDTPTGLQPAGWNDTPNTPGPDQFLWMTFCEKNASGTEIIQNWCTPVRISGEKGETGNYTEYRYAKNGNISTPPALIDTSSNPPGWAVEIPGCKPLEYVWMTKAQKSASGELLPNEKWSTPIRTNGKDGADGKDGKDGKQGDVGPAVVYRGNYDSSTFYYGTPTRVDAVKYNGTYYVASVDAGSRFQNKTPNDPKSKHWNTFGSEYESVATQLLLAEMANIGDWVIKGGKITSQQAYDGTLIEATTNIGDKTPKAQLDGTKGTATFASEIDTYSEYGGDPQKAKQIIKISSESGQVEVRNQTEGDRSYMNSQGIYANRPGISVMPEFTGVSLKGTIVAQASGKMDKASWGNWGIAGVVGMAANHSANPAPAYGGYFIDLFVSGLIFQTKIYTDTDFKKDIHQFPSGTYTYIIGNNDTTEGTLVLPPTPYDGCVLFIRSTGIARLNVRAYSSTSAPIVTNNKLSWNTYYAIGRGNLVMLVYKGGLWLLNKMGY